jgi:Leucine-rich repeat (LRR) protein
MKKVIFSIIISIALVGLLIGYQPANADTSSFDCTTVTDVPQQECEVLVTIYESTNGSGWTNQDNWLTTTTVDDWYGVSISTGHVTSLELNNNNLIGQLPAGLENLSNLTTFDLANNQLNGSIPASLGNLSELDYLSLWGNQLIGNIPDSLGDLSRLKKLLLYYNQLDGSIPESLGNLSNLTNLMLGHNQLSDSIPESLGNLSSLKYTDLSQNQLSGSIPESLGNLDILHWLILDHNQLTGNIPESLGDLNYLSTLYLFNNQLSGSIPESLGNLSNLKSLELSHNLLTGSIPAVLGNLSKIDEFSLANNQLTGNIPSELGNLSLLKFLNLHGNQLTGNIPTSLGNLSNLELLYLSSNQLSGNIPSSLGNLTKLKYLSLRINKLSGDIPTSFTNLVNLCVPGENNCTFYGLDLGYNQLNVPAPEPLTSFLAIKDPDWYETQWSTTFEDVPETHWAYDWIDRLYNAGVTSGCSQSPPLYCPEQSVTRAEMAKFLLKGVHGGEYQAPPVGESTGFDDVPADNWAADWITQLANEGITSGCGDGNYCPDDDVTRAEMAKFLLTAKHGAGYTPPPVNGGTGFNDVATSYWAAAWIKQLAVEGITSGCGSGNYCPNKEVTRAEMAKFLVLTFNLP